MASTKLREKCLNLQCCFLWIFCSDKFRTGATKELDVGTVNGRFLRIQHYGDTFFAISWKAISHPSLHLDVLEVANCFVGLRKIVEKAEMMRGRPWFLYTHPWRFLSRGHGKITIVGIAIGLTMAPWTKRTRNLALTLRQFWNSNPKTHLLLPRHHP